MTSAFAMPLLGILTTRSPSRGLQRAGSCGLQQPAQMAAAPRRVLRDGALPGKPDAKTYAVTIRDNKNGTVETYRLPEDRYIWHSMTDTGADIPASCRNGCCTTCAVKINSGEVEQKEALGLLKEMRSQGYALLCVSFPRSDIDCVMQEEDEVYVKQFGSSFEAGGVEWGGVMPEEE